MNKLKYFTKKFLAHYAAQIDQKSVIKDIVAELDLSPGYLTLLNLANLIALFGLLTNSVAVIIGAMLVAPLMSPILGLSIASVIAEEKIFERALLALGTGIVLALLLSSFWGWIAHTLPFDLLVNLPGEVLSRTHPTPFDLGIALAGGAAAAYALAQPRLSAALPGVAIATALMPPLCTAGIGIATYHWDVALGAMLLFVTNLAAISFAGILVFVVLGFKPRKKMANWHRVPRSLLISALLVLVVTIPLVFLTMRLVNQAKSAKIIQDTVAEDIASLAGAQLLDVEVKDSEFLLQLDITILTTDPPSYEEVVALQEKIALQLDRTVALELIVVPGRRLDPLVPPTRTPSPTFTATKTTQPTATRTMPPSPTSTPSMTHTPTPQPAVIANTGGRGVFLYERPGETIIGVLPEGTRIQILYSREVIDSTERLEILTPAGIRG